jgi:hypothetical protein
MYIVYNYMMRVMYNLRILAMHAENSSPNFLNLWRALNCVLLCASVLKFEK